MADEDFLAAPGADGGDGDPFSGAEDFSAPAPVADAGFFGGDADAGGSTSFTTAGGDEGPNPLAEFNARFRALNDEKDAAEKEARGARRAAAQAARQAMLAERRKLVEARKAKNREDEDAHLRRSVAALAGESWGRVASLVDLHATAGSSSGSAGGGAGGGGDKKKAVVVEGDVSRLKDVLIAVKNAPPAGAGAM